MANSITNRMINNFMFRFCFLIIVTWCSPNGSGHVFVFKNYTAILRLISIWYAFETPVVLQ